MRPMAVRITSAVALIAATLALAIVAPDAKALACNGTTSEPCVVAPGLVAEPIITSFPNYGSGGFYPTNFALAPNPLTSSRVFIADKSGRVLLYDQPGDTTFDVVLNIRGQVHDYWDRGILGLTLDPQYVGDGGSNDYIYVLYTEDRDPKDPGAQVPRWQIDSNGGDGCPSPDPGGNGSNADGCVVTAHLSKFHLDSAGIADGGEIDLVTSNGSHGWCSQFPSHSIGTLVFGPDGYLYAGAGDGASFDTADWGQLGGTRPNAGNPVIDVNPCGDPSSTGPDGRGNQLSKPGAEGGSMRSQSVLSTIADGYSTYDGAIIRVDKNGVVPGTNPLVGNGIATDDAIVAYGFRNPFRFNFKPGTNELWIGDVGRGAWEEISKATVGGTSVPNFGWPCWEGPSDNVDYLGPSGTTICNAVAGDTTQDIGSKTNVSPLVTPKIAWGHGSDWDLHTDTGCLSTTAGNTPGTSATGGSFVTSSDWPAPLQGAYVFGDYGRKCVWAITAAQAADNGTDAQTLGRSLTPIASMIQVVSVQTGPDGSIYVLDIGDIASQGGPAAGLYRIGPSRLPTAAFTFSPSRVLPGTTVSFNSAGTAAVAPATITAYSWDLNGDGNFGESTLANPTTSYGTPGLYHVALRVTDSNGRQQTVTHDVAVGVAPTVNGMTTDVGSGGFVQGQTVNYSIDASPGDNPIVGYAINGLIRHCDSPTSTGCHEHPNALGTLANAASGSFVAPGHAGYSFLQLVVTVTDSVGLTASKTFDVPAAWLVSHVDTFPTGLTVTRNGNPGTAPNVVEEIGSPTHTIAVPPVQTSAGTSYLFTGWADRPDLGPSRTFTPGSGTIDLVAQFAAANGLTSFAPSRVLDTRDGTGAPAGAVEGGTTVTLDLRAAGVPTAATGVLLNVTTTGGTQAGFVTVYPCSAPRPLASNLNYTAGQTVANLVQVAIDGTGQLCLYAHGTTHLVADLSGWFETAGQAFTPVTPTRVLDTREGTGAPVGPLAAETSLELDLSAAVPAGATTAVLNVTATEPAGAGFVTVYPCGVDRPLASNLNVTAGDTRPNQVVVALGAGSRVCLYSHTTTHLVADLLGYYGSGGVKVATQTPERVMDTRDGTGGSTRLGVGGTAVLDLSGQAPTGATGAVLNVTGVAPSGDTFVTVYQCDVERPLASNLNLTPGDIRPNLVTVPLGARGQVCLYSQSPIDLVVDVAGWAVNVA